MLYSRLIPSRNDGGYSTDAAALFSAIAGGYPGRCRDLRANRIETLTLMLFLMLAATTPTAIYGGMPSVHPIIRIGFPVVLAAVCLIGFRCADALSWPAHEPARARGG